MAYDTKLRHKLELQGRRMACAYTKGDKDGNDVKDVWVTFLRRKNPIYPEKIQRLRLHTAPSLNHNAANMELEDIDYTTVSEEMGKYVNRYNFEDRALSLWTYNCGLTLKTREELDGQPLMKRTIYDEEYDGDSSDASSDHVSNDDSECQFVMEQEATKVWTEMTSGEAFEIQRNYQKLDANKEKVDRERFFLSIKKYGRITKGSLAEGFEDRDGELFGDIEEKQFFNDEEEQFFEDGEKELFCDEGGFDFDENGQFGDYQGTFSGDYSESGHMDHDTRSRSTEGNNQDADPLAYTDDRQANCDAEATYATTSNDSGATKTKQSDEDFLYGPDSQEDLGNYDDSMGYDSMQLYNCHDDPLNSAYSQGFH